MRKISVCIITKNESEKLKKCLKQLMGYGFEIIVVDTGSTDDTVVMAKKYADKVCYFSWCNDFSAARNYALTQASNDIVMMIDSDEYLQEIDTGELEKLLKQHPSMVGRIKRINRVSVGEQETEYIERINRIFSRQQYGIDGIRLDVANEVSHRFCKELHARVKEINPDIYILGEIWHNALPWLRGDEFDAVMNYPLGQSIKDFWIDKSLTNEDFEYTINRCYTSYMQQTNDVLFNLLDSHDTKRLRSDVKNLDEYFAQIAVLFAMPGSPCIYYGTEIAMEGSYDPDCRRCMPWKDIEAGKYAERSKIIATLIHLRRQEPLLKSRNFHFPNDYAKYKRVIQFRKVDFPDCYVEVIINCCEEDVEVEQQGEILLARHYIDSTLLSNGVLIRRIRR